MKVKITNRDGKVLFEVEADSLREAVIFAVRAKADLRGSNLRDSDLRGSNLSDSDLRDSNLSGSDLRGSDLRDSNLSGSDLRGSDLRDSNLSGSDLSGSDLRDSNLSGSDLSGSNLRGSNLRGSHNIATNEESTAMLDKIREIVMAQPERLRMEHWHGENWDPSKIPETPGACGTNHCLAGWAQALSTDPKIRNLSPQTAGVFLIPTAAHMFFDSNERALKFLKDRNYA